MTRRPLLSGAIFAILLSGAATAITAQAPADEIERELLKWPSFAAIRDVDPTTYAQLIPIFRDGYASKTPTQTVIARAMTTLEPHVKRYAMSGTDAAVINYFRVMTRVAEETTTGNPAACQAFLSGGATANQAVQWEKVGEVHAALADLVTSTKGRAPRSGMEPEVAQRYLAEVVKKVLVSPRDQVLWDSDSTVPADQQRRCELVTAFQKAIGAHRDDVAADLYRFISSRSSSSSKTAANSTANKAPLSAAGRGLEAVVRVMPLFDALRDADPEAYDELSRLMKQQTAKGTAPAALEQRAFEYMSSRLFRYVMAGTDGAIVRYYQVLVRRIEQVGLANPRACNGMLTGRMVSAEEQKLTGEALDASVASMANLIKSSKGRELTIGMTPETAQGYLQNILNRVVEQPRDRELLEATTVVPRDYERHCQLNVALFKQILRQPIAVSSDIFRFMAAMTVKPAQ